MVDPNGSGRRTPSADRSRRPPSSFVEDANVTDPGIHEAFETEWPDCWERAADLLEWDEPYGAVLDDADAPFYRWFTGGRLNASHNCLDRHVDGGAKNHAAIRWEGKHGESRTYTYRELYTAVNAFAAALGELGVGEGDVVTIYLPTIPELPIAMLACARIGAPHSVVYAGLSADRLATRLEAADSDHLVTCDGYYRRGDAFNQKRKVDNAVLSLSRSVETVVVDRLGGAFEHDLADGQYDYDTLVDAHAGTTVEPVPRDAEEMLFLMYTSGTTGEPKGVVHTTGGYLAYAAWTARAVLDLKPEDTHWCTADIGWITGHSYVVYGPLALGTTTLMYEGSPDYPDRDRLWEIVDRNAVDVFYTAPTVIQAAMKWGEEYPARHDLSSLRLLGTVGEPISPRPWEWYHEHVGGGECPIVDTWWQTETGGHVVTTLPAIDGMKPGAAGPGLPGHDVRILDDAGEEVEPGRAGYLALGRPWPGMARTLYGNDERFLEEYWREFSDPEDDEWIYFGGDAAVVDADGYVTVLGRVDDVISVGGHRLSTMEIESVILEVAGVAEAAVVGAEATGVYAYVSVERGHDDESAIEERIKERIETAIGPIARPEAVIFASDLPKTRSGKIMRRLLEDVAAGEELGDTSALRNPEIVGEIQSSVRNC